jgi:hypothetical protein
VQGGWTLLNRLGASDSRRTSIWRSALLGPLVLISACNWGYGEPFDRATFESAALHEDGARCVFALHDVVYRPAEGMRAFPDGGVPRYEIDRHKLGIVDVHSGKATVLVDQKNRLWLNGHGGFHVTGLRGRWAILGQGGQRPDYEHDRVWWRLDLTSGDLTELPLTEEFAAVHRVLGRVALADEDFTLILLTQKGEGPQEIWSRTADGTLRQLAATDHYYGTAEGQIWWYDVAGRAGARSDYRTGATVRERRANFAIPRQDPTTGCAARSAGRELVFQQKIDGTWQEHPLPVRAAELR